MTHYYCLILSYLLWLYMANFTITCERQSPTTPDMFQLLPRWWDSCTWNARNIHTNVPLVGKESALCLFLLLLAGDLPNKMTSTKQVVKVSDKRRSTWCLVVVTASVHNSACCGTRDSQSFALTLSSPLRRMSAILHVPSPAMRRWRKSFWNHILTGTPSHCHSLTGTPSHCYHISCSHPHILTLSHPHTITSSHYYHTFTSSHYHILTVTLSHPHRLGSSMRSRAPSSTSSSTTINSSWSLSVSGVWCMCTWVMMHGWMAVSMRVFFIYMYVWCMLVC